MAGPQPQSSFLDVKNDEGADVKSDKGTIGNWTDAKTSRQEQLRDYAPSVMYASGKVMYIGGGSNDGGPTNMTEFIDLNDDAPKWTKSETDNMSNARRQFNATILPDGTVLVTGGTKGQGFNNLNADSTLHQAELWNPFATTQKWTVMASESVDRCYHSIALLLPDG